MIVSGYGTAHKVLRKTNFWKYELSLDYMFYFFCNHLTYFNYEVC